MASFDQDLGFDELWGSGGGAVTVGDRVIQVDGGRAGASTEFGDEVWPGAAALARALAPGGVLEGAVRRKRVLELGAGGGLPGLVCAASGAAHVVLSDLPEALPRLRRGIEANHVTHCVVKALDWRWADVTTFSKTHGALASLCADARVEALVIEFLGTQLPNVTRSLDARKWLDGKPFDVVICCDGVYKEPLVAPLLATLKRCCAPQRTVFYLANDERSHRQRRFAEALRACHFTVQELPLFPDAQDVVTFRGGSITGGVDVTRPTEVFTWYEPPLHIAQSKTHGGGFVSVGSILLADWLHATFSLETCRLFELGSGTGVVGLLSAARGCAHVTLADDRVALCAWNAARHAHLGERVAIRRVRWGHPNDLDAGDLGHASRACSEVELVVSAEETQRLDLLDDLAAEVKRRLLSAVSFGRGARACLACAPCTRPKFRAKKGWCGETSCARCRVLEECARVGVVLVHEANAGTCARDDGRFRGLADTGSAADDNAARGVLVLRLADDKREVAMREVVPPAAAASLPAVAS